MKTGSRKSFCIVTASSRATEMSRIGPIAAELSEVIQNIVLFRRPLYYSWFSCAIGAGNRPWEGRNTALNRGFRSNPRSESLLLWRRRGSRSRTLTPSSLLKRKSKGRRKEPSCLTRSFAQLFPEDYRSSPNTRFLRFSLRNPNECRQYPPLPRHWKTKGHGH